MLRSVFFLDIIRRDADEHLRARGCESNGQVEGGLVEFYCTSIGVEACWIECFVLFVLSHRLDLWVLLSEVANAMDVRPMLVPPLKRWLIREKIASLGAPARGSVR